MRKKKRHKQYSKKSRKNKERDFDKNILDYHHLLYQRRHWKNRYAKLLREHPYMGKMIPQQTLHSEIHSKIHDIPTPNGAELKAAYLELLKREKNGMIDIKNDSIEKRIDFLIEMWEEKCPATTVMLKWQKDVVSKFYKREQ